MKRVTGIGGLFFKSKNPGKLQEWYGKHLGIKPLPHSPWGDGDSAPLFEYRDKDDPARVCYAVFGLFEHDTDYFGPSPFMFNFRVNDLDALLETLRQEGVHVAEEIRDYPYGRFVKITDPEGNMIELWEPAEGY